MSWAWVMLSSIPSAWRHERLRKPRLRGVGAGSVMWQSMPCGAAQRRRATPAASHPQPQARWLKLPSFACAASHARLCWHKDWLRRQGLDVKEGSVPRKAELHP